MSMQAQIGSLSFSLQSGAAGIRMQATSLNSVGTIEAATSEC